VLGDEPSGWPSVSVVIPIRNEAEHLRAAVAAVLSQEYPRPIDVCLAVAPSDDATEAIAAEVAATSDQVTVVANPQGTTPTGLNAAIRATTGEVVVRVDGHSQLSPGYIRRAVQTMSRTGACNVGGIQNAVGETPFEQAVALAMNSWAGTGGARFHVGGKEGPVDTVYLGVFDREALEAVELFDEGLVRNQDYELNIRLRRDGGAVWFDPALQVEYRPRGTWMGLARQYFEYGRWKAEVAYRYPGSVKARQVAPVMLTVALLVSLLLPLRPFGRALQWVGLRRLGQMVGLTRCAPGAYLAATSAVAVRTATMFPGAGQAGIAVRLAGVLPTMHLAWGFGFLSGVLSRWLRR
jgi:succinoglycan biosynthesis protein ExoA